MAQATYPSQQSAATQISTEKLREQLLRPFPTISVRGVIVFLIVVGILSWALSGTAPSEVNRVDGIGDALSSMLDLLGRMLPPQFEVDEEVTFAPSVFGTELFSLTITSSTVNIFGTDLVIGWLPIVTSVFQTIQMAIIGTLGAVILSLPLALLAAKNVSPHPAVYQSIRLVLNLMRSIPELVWALLFVAAVGLGAFTGTLALVFGSVGSLTRVYAEAIEQIDPAQVQAVRATGAGGLQTFIYAVIPQALPLFISYSIIFFESNVRHATILGYVGAGGVGYDLFRYMGTSDYNKVFGTVVVLVVAVTVIDRFSSWLRQRFI